MSDGNAPAYPVIPPIDPNTGGYQWDPATGMGLTKRELFAAMFVQGLASSGQPWPSPGIDIDRMAQLGVIAADALLAELAK